MLRWLCENDFINNSEMRTSHTLMTGGVVGVPDERYDEFLALYAVEVWAKNKTLSFSELRSDPVFCMYFDIDMLDICVTSVDDTSKIFLTIQSVIKSYYTGDRNDDRFICVVCDTKGKAVPSDDAGVTLTKNGYHVTFPNLKVTVSQALQIRYSVVYELEKIMGPRLECLNAWSDVIDKAPYTNGLKMCGSFKRVKCTDCKKTDPMFKEKKKVLLNDIAKNLRIKNREYNDLRSEGVLSDPVLRVVEMGGFEKYRRRKIAAGAHDGQFKAPELTSDPNFQKNFVIKEEIRAA